MSAQQLEVFPVRVNHKTGFVKFYDGFVDTIVPPRYDYIGELYLNWNVATGIEHPSPYRLFETDQHVGLLNADLEEVLPPDYLQIRPVAPGYFAVIRDSLFQLIDQQGNLKLQEQRFQDITSGHLNPDQSPKRFIVRQNNQFGLMDSTGKTLVATTCHAVLPTSQSGFYKIKKKKKSDWYIVNSSGKRIHDNEFKEVKVINEKVLAVKKSRKAIWRLLPTNQGKKTGALRPDLLQKQCLSIQRVQPTIVALRLLPKGDDFPVVELWNLRTQTRLNAEQTNQYIFNGKPTYFPYFSPFSEKYGIKTQAKKTQQPWSTLVNRNGQALSVKFEDITTTNLPDVFIYSVKSSGSLFYGLYAPDRQPDPVLRPRFKHIESFQHNIAIYKTRNSYGAVLINDQVIKVLEPIYDHIAILEPNKIQVQLGDQIVYLKLDENNEFVEDMILDDSWAISKNVKTEIRQAAIAKIRFPKYEEIYQEPLYKDVSIRYSGDSTSVYSEQNWLTAIPITEELIPLGEVCRGVLRFRYKNTIVSTPEILAFFGAPLQKNLFFNPENHRQFGHKNIVGIKPFLHHHSVTSFMDQNGKFGLINTDGVILKTHKQTAPLSFIGPFHHGRARICMGGRLALDTEGTIPLPDRFALGSKGDFMENYQLKTTSSGFDTDSNVPVYVIPEGGEIPRWGFVDTLGKILFETEAPHLNDYHHIIPLTTVAYPNSRTRLGKPRTDFGLIDEKGKSLLPPDYSTIQFYRDYLQVGVDSTPTIYFDQQGKQLFINATRIRNFADGRAAFKNDQNEWGYLNTKGEIVITPQFKAARPFSEGLAMVVNSADKCVFIDTMGNELFATDFSKQKARAVGDFHEGRCWIKAIGTPGWMAVDRTGTMVIPPEYMVHFPAGTLNDERNIMANDFKHGISVIQTATPQKPRPFMMIDTAGQVKMSPQEWVALGPMQEDGVAVFQKEIKGLSGLVSREGKITLPPTYQKILPFEYGYARVQNRQGRWGLIDHQGKLIIPLRYENAGRLSEGLLPVQSTKNRFWNFVNLKHEMVIKGPFKTALPFQNGYSMVESISGKKHAIDKKGNLIDFGNGEVLFFTEGVFGIKKGHRATYYYADGENNNIFGRYYGLITPFTQGTARVKATHSNPKRIDRQPFAAINRRGVIIVPPKYRNLHIQPDGNIIVNPQIYYGLATTKGKMLLAPVYDKIDFFRQKEIVRVERGEMVGYIRVTDEEVEWIWELGY